MNDAWIAALAKNNLKYEKYSMKDKENWHGTMGPYLCIFNLFNARFHELRNGYRIVIGKEKDTQKCLQPSQFGLHPFHSVLLEFSSLAPEMRSSIAQSVGPMTAFISMLRATGDYRAKWKSAVKRAFAHIDCIDDIIAVTRGIRSVAPIRDIVSLLANLSMMTTTRQVTRVTLPVNMFAYAAKKDVKAYTHFNTTGKGAFYVYKVCDKRQ